MAEPGAGELLARYYDLDLAGEQADVDLYLALAESAGGPILELAAGSGRVAVPLAAAGHTVTAVDNDRHMLARADKRWQAHRQTVDEDDGAAGRGRLELIEADITRLDLGRRFSLVILALNTLLMVGGRDAQLRTLRAMADHLAPAGRAVVDIWLPSPDDLAIYDGRLTLDWIRSDPDTGRRVAKQSSGEYDPATARARVTTFFDSWPAPAGDVLRVTREDDFRLVSASELEALLEAAGLRPLTSGGDYGLTAFGTGSERLVEVCGLL
jgi:SAM-dependent methyltransferase